VINSNKYGYFEVLVDTVNCFRLKKHTWGIHYDPKLKGFYAVTNLFIEGRYRSTNMHRIITNCPKELTVDHKSHDTLDNREANLRMCTLKQNKENLHGSQRNNKTSGIRNVSWCTRTNKWVVQLQHNGLKMHIKYCTDLIEAELIAIEARNKYYSHNEEV